MNLETINKWLDEEYGCSYTKLEELHDFYFEKYCDLKQENKQLKQENEKLHHYKKLYQSLKRQKEELRSWLKEDKDKITVLDTKDNSSVRLGIMLGMGLCLEKLEELEGVDDGKIN